MTSTSIKKNWIRNSRRILDSYAKYRAIIHTDCESRSNSIVSQTCSFHERINFVTCKTRLQLCYFRSSSRITVIVELYRSRFSTHTLVEKKNKKEEKKRIVDRLFNFKANYRAPRINFEFLTFHIRKTDSDLFNYELFMSDRLLLEFREKRGLASMDNIFIPSILSHWNCFQLLLAIKMGWTSNEIIYRRDLQNSKIPGWLVPPYWVIL